MALLSPVKAMSLIPNDMTPPVPVKARERRLTTPIPTLFARFYAR